MLTMPRGKYKGVPIDQLPKDYLGRAANMNLTDEEDDEVMRAMGRPPRRQAERLRREQREQEQRARLEERRRVEEEYRQLHRDCNQAIQDGDLERARQLHVEMCLHLRKRAGKTATYTTARQELKKWYRTESMKCHPDRGGTDERQRVVNQRYEDELRRIEQSEASPASLLSELYDEFMATIP
jgi:hypothetical protein